MTIGIYCLKFNGTDRVYIGQSVSIERRFTAHILALKHRVASKKLQSAYDKHDYPVLHTIMVCTKDLLNHSENVYIKEFDSFHNGFNSLEHAEDMPNRHKNNSSGESLLKYTPEEVIHAFMYFVENPTNTSVDISNNTGVSTGMVHAMISGRSYAWLYNIDHEKYTKYIINRNHGNSAASKGIIYPNVISPEGTIHTILNRSSFAKEHNLDCGALGRVLRKQALSHKGWKICL